MRKFVLEMFFLLVLTIFFSSCNWGAICGDEYCDSSEEFMGNCPQDCNPIIPPEPECIINSDCDDNNPYTNDFCFEDFCVHGDLGCLVDEDCDDENSYTNDFCFEGVCEYEDFECLVDKDCNDYNYTTSDNCVNNECVYRELECFRDSDCNDNDDVTFDSCINNVCFYVDCWVVDDCNDDNSLTNDYCINNECSYEEFQCAVDSDCADDNSLTVDSCVNNECVYELLTCNEIVSITDCRANGMCDANADGYIDLLDSYYILDYLNNIETTCGTNEMSCFCDVNNDDLIDVFDASLLISLLTSAKDPLMYEHKEVFLVSDVDWQLVTSLVPATTWTGALGKVHKYPTLIAHDRLAVTPSTMIVYDELYSYYTTIQANDWQSFTAEDNFLQFIEIYYRAHNHGQNQTYLILEDENGTFIAQSEAYSFPYFMETFNFNVPLIEGNTYRISFPYSGNVYYNSDDTYAGGEFSGEDGYDILMQITGITPNAISSDIDSIIYFLQQYSVEKVTILGNLSQSLIDLLVAEEPLGANLLETQLNYINLEDLILYWNSFSNVVYVEHSHDLALQASAYASLINAPLVIVGSVLDVDEIFEDKNVICVGYLPRDCDEVYNSETLQQKYFDLSNTNKFLAVNPNDFDAVLSYFETDKGTSMYELYTQQSLAAPILASAKQELIVPIEYYGDDDYSFVDDQIDEAISYLFDLDDMTQTCNLGDECSDNFYFTEINYSFVEDSFMFNFSPINYDLDVTAFWINEAQINTPMNITAIITNLGSVYTSDFVVNLYERNSSSHYNLVESREISGLDGLEGKIINFEQVPDTTETHAEYKLELVHPLDPNFNNNVQFFSFRMVNFSVEMETIPESSFWSDFSIYFRGSFFDCESENNMVTVELYNNDVLQAQQVASCSELRSLINYYGYLSFDDLYSINPGTIEYRFEGAKLALNPRLLINMYMQNDFTSATVLNCNLEEDCDVILSDYESAQSEIILSNKSTIYTFENLNISKDYNLLAVIGGRTLSELLVNVNGVSLGYFDNIYSATETKYISIPSYLINETTEIILEFEDPYNTVEFFADLVLSESISDAYLTILGPPNAIPIRENMGLTSYHSNYRSLDHSEYADITGDRLPDLLAGRIMSLSIADVSSYIARSLFYDEILKTNNVSFMASSFQYMINQAYNWSHEFEAEGYNSECFIQPAGDYGSDFDCEIMNDGFDESQWIGRDLIHYLDHGGSGWAGISSFELPYLSNSLVLNDACSTCSTYRFNSFCNNVIRKGGIGHAGAVSVAWTGNQAYKKMITGVYQEDLSIGKAFKKAYVYARHRFMTSLVADPTLDMNVPYLLDDPLEFQ